MADHHPPKISLKNSLKLKHCTPSKVLPSNSSIVTTYFGYLYRLDEYRQVFERLVKDADIRVIYYDFADVQVSIYQHFMSHMIAAVCPNQADGCYSLRVVFEQIISGNQRYLLILDNIECLYQPSNLQSSETKDFIGSLRTCLDVYRTNIRTAMLCRDTANLRKLYHDYREPFYCFGYLQDVGR